MSTLARLKSSLNYRVCTIEALLGTMTTPVKNIAQEIGHAGYIKRINDLTFEANINLLDIEDNTQERHRNHRACYIQDLHDQH